MASAHKTPTCRSCGIEVLEGHWFCQQCGIQVQASGTINRSNKNYRDALSTHPPVWPKEVPYRWPLPERPVKGPWRWWLMFRENHPASLPLFILIVLVVVIAVTIFLLYNVVGTGFDGSLPTQYP